MLIYGVLFSLPFSMKNAMAALADPLFSELRTMDRREEVADTNGEKGSHPRGWAGRCKSEAWLFASSQSDFGLEPKWLEPK